MVITDKMVDAAALAYDRWRCDHYAAGYYHWHRPAMRVALEAIAKMVGNKPDGE